MSITDDSAVEKKGQDAATDQEEVNKNDSQASEDQGVDYKAELERLTTENKKLSGERDNYKQGMLNAKDQLEKKGYEEDDGEEESDVKSQVKEALNEILPEITKQFSTTTFDSLVGEYSNNPDEQKLIKYHFENSVSSNLPIRERIENAKLISNKSAILKTQSELATALKNKTGMARFSTTSGGNQDNSNSTKEFFSPEQIETLKKKGLDPKKVEENYKKVVHK